MKKMLKRVKSLGKAMGFSRKGSKSGPPTLLRCHSENHASVMSPEAAYVFKSAGELSALKTLVEEVLMQLGLLGGKSAARLRCSEAFESILALVREQHDGLANLEMVADAKEQSGVAPEDVQRFERAWGAVLEELSATSDAVLQAQERIALLPGGGLGSGGNPLPSMAKCAEEVERCGIELKVMVEGVLEKLPAMPALSATERRFSPLAESITPVSQADTEPGHDRYLSSEEERTPSPVPARRGGQRSPLSQESAPSPCTNGSQPECQESTTPRESPPPCESPRSPPARHWQVLPPPSPFDAGAAEALSSIPSPGAIPYSTAEEEEEQAGALDGAWEHPSPPSSPTFAAGQEEEVAPCSPFDAETPHKPATPPAAGWSNTYYPGVSHGQTASGVAPADVQHEELALVPTNSEHLSGAARDKTASESDGGSASLNRNGSHKTHVAERSGDTLEGSPPASPPPFYEDPRPHASSMSTHTSGEMHASTPPRTAARRALMERELLEETPDGKGLARGLFLEVDPPLCQQPSRPYLRQSVSQSVSLKSCRPQTCQLGSIICTSKE